MGFISKVPKRDPKTSLKVAILNIKSKYTVSPSINVRVRQICEPPAIIMSEDTPIYTPLKKVVLELSLPRFQMKTC
jgi:hypothetical protein